MSPLTADNNYFPPLPAWQNSPSSVPETQSRGDNSGLIGRQTAGIRLSARARAHRMTNAILSARARRRRRRPSYSPRDRERKSSFPRAASRWKPKRADKLCFLAAENFPRYSRRAQCRPPRASSSWYSRDEKRRGPRRDVILISHAGASISLWSDDFLSGAFCDALYNYIRCVLPRDRVDVILYLPGAKKMRGFVWPIRFSTRGWYWRFNDSLIRARLSVLSYVEFAILVMLNITETCWWWIYVIVKISGVRYYWLLDKHGKLRCVSLWRVICWFLPDSFDTIVNYASVSSYIGWSRNRYWFANNAPTYIYSPCVNWVGAILYIISSSGNFATFTSNWLRHDRPTYSFVKI